MKIGLACFLGVESLTVERFWHFEKLYFFRTSNTSIVSLINDTRSNEPVWDSLCIIVMPFQTVLFIKNVTDGLEHRIGKRPLIDWLQ